ncbi:MAG: ABC transporter ATP-binding protein [Clostridia bacterium]
MSNQKNTSEARPPIGGGGPRGMMAVEKPKDFVGSLKNLANYAKSYLPIFIFAIILAICSSVFSLIGPSKLSEITDLIIAGMMTQIDTNAVKSIAMFLITIYAIGFVFSYIQGCIMATVSQKICRNLRRDLVEKINKLPLSYFDIRSYGDTLSHVTNDVDTIANSLNQSLSSSITGIITFLGAVILMFYTNWIMALSGIIAVVLGMILAGSIIKMSQKYFREQQVFLGKINGNIEEVYTGHTIVRAYNAEKYVEDIFEKNNVELYKSAWKAQYMSILMMPIMGFVGNLAYVVVCIVGALLAVQDIIAFSVIVAFMLYIRLATQPLTTLAQAVTALQSAAAASERVFKLFDEEEIVKDSDDTVEITNVRGEVEFRDVHFGYTDKMIIKGFSAKIEAGQKVAIVGPTGAGKTTIVNLLMRFYEINQGEILIDGISTKNITRANVRDMFSMVLQDTWLFDGSILENIVYCEENITKEQVIDACKSVGIHRTILTLPEGYDTVMENATLSSGEKQLITIARAMIKKSELLILDEATSSVDTRTELLIANAMDILAKNKTSFIIAHRLSTIKNADVILVMRDGNIVESGNHDNLLEKNGFYAELYNSQFETD